MEQQLREEKQPTTDKSEESFQPLLLILLLCRSYRTPTSSPAKTLPCTLPSSAGNGFTQTTDSLISASQEFSTSHRKE